MDMSQPPMDSIKTAHVLAVDDDDRQRRRRGLARIARAERSPAEAWPVQRTVSTAAAKT
jgi:hypothetical protein